MGEGYFILRRKLVKDFTVLSNDILRDRRLTWPAIGVLSHLLHYPPDFRLNLTHIVKQTRSGKCTTRTALKVLQRLGYVAITRERDDDGRYFRVVWNVTDSPATQPKSGFRTVDFPPAEKPTEGNQPLLNTKKNKELKAVRTIATTAVVPNGSKPRVVVDAFEISDLKIPAILLGHRERSTAKILAKCPPKLRQDVLDEIAGTLSRGVQIRSPIGLLKSLVTRACEGDFYPSAGADYAEKQRQVAAERARTVEEVAHRHPGGPTPASQEARQAMSRLFRVRKKRLDP